MTNFELQINDSEGFLAFVETLKTNRSKACMSVPTQVGARTLQLSKLMMEKAYYLHMRRLFPKMRLLFTDTHSVMVQIFELQDPLHAMAEANLNGAALFDVAGKSKDPERDLSALSAAARAKAIEVMGQLGKLGDETFPPGSWSTWACTPRCTAFLRSSPTARARRSAVEIVKKSLLPFNDKVYGLDAHNLRPLNTGATGAAADAGRLRSARPSSASPGKVVACEGRSAWSGRRGTCRSARG